MFIFTPIFYFGSQILDMILHAWLNPDTCWEVLVLVMHIDVVFQQKHIGHVVCCVLTETFTTDCPEWNDCDNNPQRSFWNRASTAVSAASDHHTWFWHSLTWSKIQKKKQRKINPSWRWAFCGKKGDVRGMPTQAWLLHQWGFVVFLWKHIMHFSPGWRPTRSQPESLFSLSDIQNKNTIEKEERSTTHAAAVFAFIPICTRHFHTCSLQMLPAVMWQ